MKKPLANFLSISALITMAFIANASIAQSNFVPGQLLVQFRANVSDDDEHHALSKYQGEILERIKSHAMHLEGRGNLIVARFLPDRALNKIIQSLNAHPAIEYAEPNWIYKHQAISNDTYYINGSLWGMYGDDATPPSNTFGIRADETWEAGCTGSDNVYVGIIDEGIQFMHPDLRNNIWTNGFDPEDGIDNDGNGKIDDIHGWDFSANNKSIYDGGLLGKADQHGTHVAGTIGATGGNGIGVAGVNWNVTMISGKFLGANGGTTANAIKAIDYFTDLKLRHGLNIVATNNSWGGGGFSRALLDAINRGGDAGILFVAAAGNGGLDGRGDNNDTRANYPSNYECTSNGKDYDCVIAVAALNRDGTLASFSNFGARTVDVAAPGSGIWSTIPVNKYATFSGTSMATPHVTGAVALYASINSGATPAEIKAAILENTIPTPSLAGKTVTGGRLNVEAFCR